MKQYILLNPSAIDVEVLGRGFPCKEIERMVKFGIARVAKRAIYNGKVCDLTEFFSKEWVRAAYPGLPEIIVKPGEFKEVILKNGFSVFAETERVCFLEFHSI